MYFIRNKELLLLLLLLLYTNDINYLMKDCNPILFADDTTIVHVAENATILSLELNVIL